MQMLFMCLHDSDLFDASAHTYYEQHILSLNTTIFKFNKSHSTEKLRKTCFSFVVSGLEGSIFFAGLLAGI
jgi:hypothetical protein